jgi:putative membrane protein
MMYYGGGHMSGWGWFGMTIGMISFWGLLIGLAVLVYRMLTRGNASGGTTSSGEGRGPAATDPRQILAERYARGEIDEDEYQRRLATLAREGTPGHPVAP